MGPTTGVPANPEPAWTSPLTEACRAPPATGGPVPISDGLGRLAHSILRRPPM